MREQCPEEEEPFHDHRLSLCYKPVLSNDYNQQGTAMPGALVQVLLLPWILFVTLGKSHQCSVPQFPYL